MRIWLRKSDALKSRKTQISYHDPDLSVIRQYPMNWSNTDNDRKIMYILIWKRSKSYLW